MNVFTLFNRAGIRSILLLAALAIPATQIGCVTTASAFVEANVHPYEQTNDMLAQFEPHSDQTDVKARAEVSVQRVWGQENNRPVAAARPVSDNAATR